MAGARTHDAGLDSNSERRLCGELKAVAKPIIILK